MGYLRRGKNRPPLMAINDAHDFVLEHILFHQAPRFNFISSGPSPAPVFLSALQQHTCARKHSHTHARYTYHPPHWPSLLPSLLTHGHACQRGRSLLTPYTTRSAPCHHPLLRRVGSTHERGWPVRRLRGSALLRQHLVLCLVAPRDPASWCCLLVLPPDAAAWCCRLMPPRDTNCSKTHTQACSSMS